MRDYGSNLEQGIWGKVLRDMCLLLRSKLCGQSFFRQKLRRGMLIPSVSYVAVKRLSW